MHAVEEGSLDIGSLDERIVGFQAKNYDAASYYYPSRSENNLNPLSVLVLLEAESGISDVEIAEMLDSHKDAVGPQREWLKQGQLLEESGEPSEPADMFLGSVSRMVDGNLEEPDEHLFNQLDEVAVDLRHIAKEGGSTDRLYPFLVKVRNPEMGPADIKERVDLIAPAGLKRGTYQKYMDEWRERRILNIDGEPNGKAYQIFDVWKHHYDELDEYFGARGAIDGFLDKRDDVGAEDLRRYYLLD